ncbi:hypothetical protein CYMTET_45943 [Cymbomonas tetramitiformis]|uniref:Uncharacterized protein n=1 Tax=Cymbomonas tetramitiformis TaxID=36881 RepID=A0AAE0BX57_9CHLO|nr:hypothetical protein CYMTET_45943 [Cymbomonas tetramitiformis]
MTLFPIVKALLARLHREAGQSEIWVDGVGPNPPEGFVTFAGGSEAVSPMVQGPHRAEERQRQMLTVLVDPMKRRFNQTQNGIWLVLGPTTIIPKPIATAVQAGAIRKAFLAVGRTVRAAEALAADGVGESAGGRGTVAFFLGRGGRFPTEEDTAGTAIPGTDQCEEGREGGRHVARVFPQTRRQYRASDGHIVR